MSEAGAQVSPAWPQSAIALMLCTSKECPALLRDLLGTTGAIRAVSRVLQPSCCLFKQGCKTDTACTVEGKMGATRENRGF